MRILYHDDRVAVCVKPAGVLSTDEPGGMPELLRAELGTAAAVRSVHRLDRAAGGVMVYALTRRAAAELSRQIRDGSFQKKYLTVVRGVPDEASGTMRDWLHRDRARRMTFAVPPGAEEAQEALLAYETLACGGGLSLLAVTLHTGRTHQIRCQLSSRGLPIVGDRKYGNADDGCALALWSWEIGFAHPRTGERLLFSAAPLDERPWSLFDRGLYTTTSG